MIESLRTIHWNFSGRTVSDEDIGTIVEHGMRAACATNLANYSVVVVDGQDNIRKLVNNSGPARCLVFCLDFSRIVKEAARLGYDYVPDVGWYGFMTHLYDVYAVVQTCVVAAKSMGIDSLVTNGLYRAGLDKVKEALHLPDRYCLPVMALLVGYSDLPADAVTGRLPARYVIHYGEYREPDEKTLDETIAAFDGIYPGYISEMYPHALDWYHNEWLVTYPGHPGEKDIRLRDAVVRAGFMG